VVGEVVDVGSVVLVVVDGPLVDDEESVVVVRHGKASRHPSWPAARGVPATPTRSTTVAARSREAPNRLNEEGGMGWPRSATGGRAFLTALPRPPPPQTAPRATVTIGGRATAEGVSEANAHAWLFAYARCQSFHTGS